MGASPGGLRRSAKINHYGWLAILAGVSFLALPTATAQQKIGQADFDNWLFQGTGANDEKGALKYFNQQIETQIGQLTKQIAFDNNQIARIKLAGRGDIKRFMDSVNQARRKFREVAGEDDDVNLQDVISLVTEPQQMVRAGLFGEQSLLQKVARGIATGPQRGEMEAERKRREKLKATVDLLSELFKVGTALGLSTSQVEQLYDRLEPQVFRTDESHANETLVGYLLSQLDAEVVDEILDPWQRPGFAKWSKRYESRKGYLENMGLLAKD